jgi:transcriptional regulator with XRE-family HTH domain
MARVKAISKNLRTTFGKNLALLREKAGLTQEAFAEKLDIHLTHLQKLEYGHVTPSFGTLVHIRRVLDCTWEELLEAVR